MRAQPVLLCSVSVSAFNRIWYHSCKSTAGMWHVKPHLWNFQCLTTGSLVEDRFFWTCCFLFTVKVSSLTYIFWEILASRYFGFISSSAFFWTSKVNLRGNQSQRAWHSGVLWVRWQASRSLLGSMPMGSSPWSWRPQRWSRGTGRPASCWHAVQGWLGTFYSSSKGHNWCTTWRRGTQWSIWRRRFGMRMFSSHPVVTVATYTTSVWEGSRLISFVRCRMRSPSTSNFSPLSALLTTPVPGSGFWVELVLCAQGYVFRRVNFVRHCCVSERLVFPLKKKSSFFYS